MKYKELMAQIKEVLGEVNWSMIGKLTKTYNIDFLSSCVAKIKKEAIEKMDEKERTGYLISIVRNHAKPSDCKGSLGKRFFEL